MLEVFRDISNRQRVAPFEPREVDYGLGGLRLSLDIAFGNMLVNSWNPTSSEDSHLALNSGFLSLLTIGGGPSVSG